MEKQELLKHFKEWQNYINKQQGQDYPCGNQVVIGGIFTQDFIKAEKFIESLNIPIQQQSRSRLNHYWILEDGQRWHWFSGWRDSMRGYRFNKIAIDLEVLTIDLFRMLRVYTSHYGHFVVTI